MQNFSPYRDQVIGIDQQFATPYGIKQLIYADWTASGRLYRPIEEYITTRLGPFVGNTHTDSTMTGTVMSSAYRQARQIIKDHVNAQKDDLLFLAGSGMTTVINKLQRMIGLRIPEQYRDQLKPSAAKKALVIITHMEHHSNQTSWQECQCDVEIIRPDKNGLPDPDHLEAILLQYHDRPLKIGSFTACSNVTGIITPFHRMAEIMHRHNGYCFIDFTAGAPYLKIDMHPANQDQRLDAIFFSPHKFLGGPGSCGVMLLNQKLYQCQIPDQPGGGTVLWTDPWGGRGYSDDIETREDGGTPGFLQAVRASLAILLKEKMGTEALSSRKEKLKKTLLIKIADHPLIRILEPKQENRLGIVSFYSPVCHYNLIVRLLNDRFGIQTRGGCSCAGTYGHILLNVCQDRSAYITGKISKGDLSEKPGWVRISLHPVMTDAEVEMIANSVNAVLDNYQIWEKDYFFDNSTGEYQHNSWQEQLPDLRKEFC